MGNWFRFNIVMPHTFTFYLFVIDDIHSKYLEITLNYIDKDYSYRVQTMWKNK